MTHSQRELETLGLDDLCAKDSILLIEWGEKFPRFVAERDVEISLQRESETSRRIRVTEGQEFNPQPTQTGNPPPCI